MIHNIYIVKNKLTNENLYIGRTSQENFNIQKLKNMYNNSLGHNIILLNKEIDKIGINNIEIIIIYSENVEKGAYIENEKINFINKIKPKYK